MQTNLCAHSSQPITSLPSVPCTYAIIFSSHDFVSASVHGAVEPVSSPPVDTTAAQRGQQRAKPVWASVTDVHDGVGKEARHLLEQPLHEPRADAGRVVFDLWDPHAAVGATLDPCGREAVAEAAAVPRHAASNTHHHYSTSR